MALSFWKEPLIFNIHTQILTQTRHPAYSMIAAPCLRSIRMRVWDWYIINHRGDRSSASMLRLSFVWNSICGTDATNGFNLKPIHSQRSASAKPINWGIPPPSHSSPPIFLPSLKEHELYLQSILACFQHILPSSNIFHWNRVFEESLWFPVHSTLIENAMGYQVLGVGTAYIEPLCLLPTAPKCCVLCQHTTLSEWELKTDNKNSHETVKWCEMGNT